MPHMVPQLKILSRETMQRKFKFGFLTKPRKTLLRHQISCNPMSSLVPFHDLHNPERSILQTVTKAFEFHFLGTTETIRFVHLVGGSDKATESDKDPEEHSGVEIQNILKNCRESSTEEIEVALDQCGLVLTDEFVLNVLKRNRSDWKLAYTFFKWVSRGGTYLPGSAVFNETLDILGKMRRFEELNQVFDEMSDRKGLLNDRTFEVLLNRYSAAHKVEEAISVYNYRKEFGIKDDLVAFQGLLLWLCRYKHVEFAETLFYSKQTEFGSSIKTRNIILNGWCVLGNVHEAKRFWKDIVASKCKPDLFTYGTFINALTKKGKLGTAMKLFRAMWEKGCNPDVVICNCVIDALCFKKRIPEALEVFKEMRERGCYPNVATYNSLIKHLCKIQRMEKVHELLDEMEQRKGSCLPNDITYIYLLKSLKRPKEVAGLLERMKRNQCKMTGDMYNLILKLYMDWDDEEKVRSTWHEMEKSGLGPDQRSFTIMIHGLYDKGRIKDALCCFSEMTSKGMVPEPRTDILVNAMNKKLKTAEEQGVQ